VLDTVLHAKTVLAGVNSFCCCAYLCVGGLALWWQKNFFLGLEIVIDPAGINRLAIVDVSNSSIHQSITMRSISINCDRTALTFFNNSHLMYNRTIELWHSTTIFIIIVVIMRISLQTFALNKLFIFVLTLVLIQVKLRKH